MKDSVDQKIKEIIAKAQKDKSELKYSPSTRRRSSLHRIIKTKEQADRFMRQLRAS